MPNAEVGDSHTDIVLALGSVTRNVQMKTLNKRHAPNPYNVAASLFDMPGGCVIWTVYDPALMEIRVYHMLGEAGNGKLGGVEKHPESRRKVGGNWVPRPGYVGVRTYDAKHFDLKIEQLAGVLFGLS